MSKSLESDATIVEPESELRLRAERAESRLAELLSSMPEAYVAIDRDWRITSGNEQAARMSRKPTQEFVGKSVWAVWPESVGTEVERQYRRVMETRVPAQFEYFSSANHAWFELYVKPSEDGIGVYFRDITQRRRAQEALKESERRYRVFTELNPQLIFTTDANGQVTYANQHMLDYIGASMEKLSGEGWRTAVHPADESRVFETWMGAVARDVDFEAEARIRRASDESFRWFWLRGLPIRDEQNKTLYWLGVCTEIHERKIAVEELISSQRETEHQRAELETVYRTAPIGLALFDPVEFRFLSLNDRQAELVGLPITEILGRTVIEIAPIEGLYEMFQQVAKGQPITNMLLEGELPMQPGVHRYWTVNYSPVYGPDGAVRAITAASLEITAQKRAEVALIQSEKLAAVGRLASSISHEINNPLEAVINLLYLATSSTELPEEIAAYLRTAQDELGRVSQMATQSLRFHRQTMNPTRVGAAELIESVLNLYQGRLFNSDIEVHAFYASSSRMTCFENDIRQVLNNLIANATDAMRHGGRLLLRTHDTTDWKTGRKGIRLTIADTGHGMSEHVKKRLFEPFYTTKDLNGTGLGLWISKEIVARHHGRLVVRSSEMPGRSGTVFTLFLPDGEHLIGPVMSPQLPLYT
jgi:PAS domain S-box-containing protein